MPWGSSPSRRFGVGIEVDSNPTLRAVAHFHLWLIPKKDEGELRGVAYMAQQPPLTASLSEAEAMSQKIRAEFEAS